MSERSFDPSTLTRAASDAFTVRRVFGEAYERDGRLVVPVARVAGLTGSGAGAGSGTGPGEVASPDDEPGTTAPHGTGDGGGGGFATHVTPLGVVVVDDAGTRWHPTVDVNRAILGGQVALTVVATAWALAWAVRRR